MQICRRVANPYHTTHPTKICLAKREAPLDWKLETNTQLNIILHKSDSVKYTSPSCGQIKRVKNEEAIPAECVSYPNSSYQKNSNVSIQKGKNTDLLDWKLKPTTELKVMVDKLDIILFKKEGIRRRSTRRRSKPQISCDHCQKIFTCMSELARHIRSHLSERPHKCEICQSTFKSISDVNQHHKRVHSNEKGFKCKFCGHGFLLKFELESHMMTHTGEKPYKCEACGKSFARQDGYRVHLLAHFGKRPYPCTFCDKAFISNSHRNRHIRTHTGEKPFKCPLCPLVSSQTDALRSHMLTHTGEKPFKCPTCNKGFRRSDHVISHLKIHTRDRPYVCLLCKVGFKERLSLKNHLKTKTHENVKRGGKIYGKRSKNMLSNV